MKHNSRLIFAKKLQKEYQNKTKNEEEKRLKNHIIDMTPHKTGGNPRVCIFTGIKPRKKKKKFLLARRPAHV